MDEDRLRFTVTRLSATVPEGVPITWRGREFVSGPLTIELAARDLGTANQGVLDYTTRRARAEFHVRLSFPQFAETLEDLGVDPALSTPVNAVLRSEGDILDDHGFALSGTCDLERHGLLPAETTRAAVLPGHWRPDAGSRSGAQIRAALQRGESVSWRFTPDQKRLSITLPPELGGERHEVCLTGGYTFTPAVALAGAA